MYAIWHNGFWNLQSTQHVDAVILTNVPPLTCFCQRKAGPVKLNILFELLLAGVRFHCLCGPHAAAAYRPMSMLLRNAALLDQHSAATGKQAIVKM